MVRSVQLFGGRHTELKLQVVMAYLAAYLRVMKRQGHFTLCYIDAFAGTGWSQAGISEDERQTSLISPSEPRKGSPLRVLDLQTEGRSFDRFIFNDRRVSAIRKLQAEILEHASGRIGQAQIEFYSQDGDSLISQICDRLGSRDRAVMFLDPFGMQVSWRSIERVAACGRIDLWYLAPVGAAYGRLMQRRGSIPEQRRRLLDEALGGRGWEASIFKQSPPDLLGYAPDAREQGWEEIAAYFMKQWKHVFGPGALSTALPLGHPGRLPFLLCFGCSNPSPAAYVKALTIAGHLMEMARGGRLV